MNKQQQQFQERQQNRWFQNYKFKLNPIRYLYHKLKRRKKPGTQTNKSATQKTKK